MKRDDALRLLAEHKAELAEEFGVTAIWLFGSVARDEAGPDSDVDVLVELGRRPFGYFEFFRLQERLSKILGSPVDLGTPDSLRNRIRDDVLQEAIRAA